MTNPQENLPNRGPVPDGPSAVANLLEALRDGLANGSAALRGTALAKLKSHGLRSAMTQNPRLTKRINQRLTGTKGWGVPNEIQPFPETENLIHLLTIGPESCFADIGLAWHGNTLSRIVMRGGGKALADVEPQRLRRALALRHPDAAEAVAELPSPEALRRDGALCLLAWANQLPGNIAPTVTAVLLKDPTLLDMEVIDRSGGRVASSIAAAWLAADRGRQP